MKTAIIYYSKHHGNTKKLLDAIKATNEIDLIDVTKGTSVELAVYDRIGIASGIYYSSFAKPLLEYASANLPENKQVFYIATCGSPRKNYFDAIGAIAKEKNCKNIGHYSCLGFDTYGPFKFIGGIAKGHPTDQEIQGAIDFYKSLG